MSKFVVIDLEMCNVQKGSPRKTFGWKNELIQIGAVLLDKNYNISDTFMSYVHPEFGSVDLFIENLTGITRDDVRCAPVAEKALQSFSDWIPEGAVLVSWSENDKIQIQKELSGKQIKNEKLESLLETWLDCQKEFGKIMESGKNYKLSEALIIADIDWTNGEHDALVDAKNTALLFAKMETEPDFELNSYYTTETESPATYSPFADLLKHYQFAV